MIDLRNFSHEEMEELAESMGQPRYRGRQLFQWVHKGKTEFREMNNLPGSFLNRLEQECRIDPLELLRRQASKEDGTQKFLFGLTDGNAVESVFMRYRYGNSVCISSQAGCRMGCSFCASGLDGLSRNLTAGEMLSQVMDIEAETAETVSHVVVMGTGEPFDNYENLSAFLNIISDPKGRNLGSRNVTVSTCGIVPGIDRFAVDFPQTGLAVSLHAANDTLRSSLMPVNKAYPLSKLMAAADRYTKKTNRRLTYEYALIRGVNDRPEDIRELGELLRGRLCHVNLIPLNEVEETGYCGGDRKRAKEYGEYLENVGIPTTVRRQLGADIDGACGQLRLENRKKPLNGVTP